MFKGDTLRRMLAALTVAAFVVALGAPAFAKEETVKGQIVDETCYLKELRPPTPARTSFYAPRRG